MNPSSVKCCVQDKIHHPEPPSLPYALQCRTCTVFVASSCSFTCMCTDCLYTGSCWRVLEPSVAWLILVSEPDPHCTEKIVWEIGWSGSVPGARSAGTPLIPLSKRNSCILMCKISAITSATLLSMVCDYADMHTHA